MSIEEAAVASSSASLQQSQAQQGLHAGSFSAGRPGGALLGADAADDIDSVGSNPNAADLEQDLAGVLDADEADAQPDLSSGGGGGEAGGGGASRSRAGQGDGEEDDDDGEDDEDEDDEEEEEEEEEEPKLKYQRLGASVSSILKKDTAKCLLAHEKFLVLGTASGRLFILDLNGNEIMSFAVHSAAVNDLSLDCNGDYVASCSNDGTVVITNLFTREHTKHSYARGIKSVALPGQYKHNTMFACGGAEGRFLINTKGWFSSKDNVIHAGEGPIGAVKWRRELLAWANDSGVKIYDVNTSERITHIARAAHGAPPPPPAELHKCHLCWSKDDTLLIGWADSVKIGVVKTRHHASPSHPSSNPSQNRPMGGAGPIIAPTTSRYVQIIAMFNVDFMICGIAPWGGEHLVLMAFLEDECE